MLGDHAGADRRAAEADLRAIGRDEELYRRRQDRADHIALDRRHGLQGVGAMLGPARVQCTLRSFTEQDHTCVAREYQPY